MEREANASAAPAGPPPAAAKQAGASRGGMRSGRLLMRASLRLALIALVLGLLAVASFFAQRQPPHPDMLRPVGDWDLAKPQWWGYPLERNAFKRRVVRGGLTAVFALPNTQKLWVVGHGGLILHSGDDGVTWIQQRPVIAAAELAMADRRVGAAWSLLGTAVAQQAADTKGAPANAAAQQPSADSPYSSGTAEPASAAPTRPAQVVIPSPSGVSRTLASARPEAVQQAPVKRKAKAATAAARASAPAASTAAPAPVIGTVEAPLRDVFFVDELVGWAVGDDGTTLATHNGGASWATQQSGSTAWLRSVQFNRDGRRGWAVGGGGTILATADGGASWTTQQSNSTAGLASVQFNSDGQRGWAVGDGGTILATANGGTSWAAQSSRSKEWLTSVHFNSDGQRGWAVGANGTILATANGGARWAAHTSGSKVRLSSVHFNSDGQRGWAAGIALDFGTGTGNATTILSTRDGGASWADQTSRSSAWLRSVQFNSDGQRGWAVGGHGAILATRDGGVSWVAQTSGDAATLENVQLNSDGQRGWAVTGSGTILATTNGGASWASQSSGSTEQLTSVHFNSDGQRGWAVGDGGTIVATANGGAQWAAQESRSTESLKSVQFNSDGQRGWAVGDGGTILATRDGGASWATQTSSSTAWLWNVHFNSDGQRGWTVGGYGKILATANGGTTWAAQTSGNAAWLTSVQFTSDGQRGWAVGKDGTILAARNGGANWAAQPSGSQAWLQSVLFNSDGQRGWAVGDNGTILATANGGATWATQPRASTSHLTSVQFDSNGLQGLVVGHDGTVLTTTDGGKVWSSTAHYQRFWPPWYAAVLVLLSITLFALLGLVEPVKKGATANDRDEPAPEGAATLLRSDQPVADKRFDRLGVRPAVEALSSFIRNRETEPRVTLAVTGEWGNGKSSVMRMLQTELEHAGFRSAWFNAWHHQQEGRQLSALFNVVRQQAVPAVWRQPFGAIRVRSRLIWGRGVFYKAVAVVSAVTLALLLGDMLAHGPVKAFDHVGHNFRHHLLQQRQTAITGASLAKLNPFAKPVASAASGAASAASAAADPAKPGRAKPMLTAAAVVPKDPCQDKARLSATRIAEPVRPELYCYMLQNLQWDEGGDSSRCGVQHKPAVEPARRCVFASAHDLIATLEARGTGGPHRLWPSEKKAVLAAAETLPPPAVFPWLEQSLLGGLAGLLVLAFGKGIAVYGVQLTAPLRALLAAGSGEANAGKEASGTIERYRAEFCRLCDALDGRLVIFIDDLDRCTPETVNGMLELTNYLADVGRCFVVIGAAMDRVQRCVRSPETTVYDEDYAIAYLRKLVHIELPVPRHRELLNQFANAAPTGFAGPPALSRARRRTGIGLLVVGGLTLLLLVFIGGQRLHKGSVGTALQVDAVGRPAVEPGTSKPVVGTLPDPVVKPVRPVRHTAVGLVPTPPSTWPAAWLGVAGLIAVAGLAGVAGFLWRWVRRHRERLVIALGGAVRTKDSNHFMEALQIWNPVVVSYDPTPRHVKRFYNRARLFAAYEREDADATTPTDDECLVALAAMHHLDPSSLGSLATFLPRGTDRVTGLKAWLDAAERAANSAPDKSAAGDRQRQRQQALQSAWELHLKAFASVPSALQVRRFASRVEGILVR